MRIVLILTGDNAEELITGTAGVDLGRKYATDPVMYQKAGMLMAALLKSTDFKKVEWQFEHPELADKLQVVPFFAAHDTVVNESATKLAKRIARKLRRNRPASLHEVAPPLFNNATRELRFKMTPNQ